MMFFLQMSGFNVMVFYCVPILAQVSCDWCRADPMLTSNWCRAMLTSDWCRADPRADL